MKYLFTAFLAVFSISTAVASRAAPVRPAGKVPATSPSQADVTTTLQAMLTDYRRYAETQWHADTAHPDMGYWGTGHANGGNEGARAVSTTALIYALLAHDGDTTFPIADRVGPALRYAAAIHATGTMKGTDGQTWGDSWQSAMWAGNLGTAAWLAKDKLDLQIRRRQTRRRP